MTARAADLHQAPDYGRAFALWRAACPADWARYMRHPFVEGLRDGSLPQTHFLHYLVQDYLYLIHYGRAWALGVVKAQTVEEMRACAATVHALIVEETALHLRLCADAGIDLAAMMATPERRENLAYTRYVLEAGYSGDFLDLMAALAPCVFGYGEIGARLLAEAGDTPYRLWIETYGGTEYQAVCRRVGALLDQALELRLGPDWHSLPRAAQLAERFTMATRLEGDFWQMGMEP